MPNPAGIQAAEQRHKSVSAGLWPDCKKYLIIHPGSLCCHLCRHGDSSLAPEGNCWAVGSRALGRGDRRDPLPVVGIENLLDIELGLICYQGDV